MSARQLDPSGAVIVLEGADSAGKTTLASALPSVWAERLVKSIRQIHCGLYADPFLHHCAVARRAFRLAAAGHLVIVDRCWLSHLIYGEVFNNQQYDAGARWLDEAFRLASALTVLCIPGDPRRQEADWRAGKDAGKIEHFSSVREVIALYLDLAKGNIARPGSGYLGEMIRYGDYAERDGVIVYDRYAFVDRQVRAADAALHYAALLREKRTPDYAAAISAIEEAYRGRASA